MVLFCWQTQGEGAETQAPERELLWRKSSIKFIFITVPGKRFTSIADEQPSATQAKRPNALFKRGSISVIAPLSQIVEVGSDIVQ
jgi:hypothetical protein